MLDLDKKSERESKLETQLSSAQFALTMMEGRCNKRVSDTSVDAAKHALLSEEFEALQIRFQALQDELDNSKEEFAFRGTRIEKLEAQVLTLEAKISEQMGMIAQANAVAATREGKIAELEGMLKDSSKVCAMRMCVCVYAYLADCRNVAADLLEACREASKGHFDSLIVHIHTNIHTCI